MRQTHELIIEDGVLAQAAQAHAHALTEVTVELRLRAVILLTVLHERIRRARQTQLHRRALILSPAADDLLFRGLILKRDGDCSHMAVRHRHADALRADQRLFGVYDHAVFLIHMTEDLQRLFLGFLLLAADVRNHVIHHLGPGLEVLSGTGNRLIGADHDLLWTELAQRVDRGGVALNGTVRLHRHETAGGAQTLLLELDDLGMLGIDLRNDHGDIRGPAVRAVIRHHGDLVLRVFVLDLTDLFFLHVDCAEHEVHVRGHGVNVADVTDRQIRNFFRNRNGHLPAAFHRLAVGLSRRARARSQAHELKPRMIRQQRHEALAHHTGRAQNTNLIPLRHLGFLLNMKKYRSFAVLFNLSQRDYLYNSRILIPSRLLLCEETDKTGALPKECAGL